jgi:hypothetical protein
LLAVAAAAVVVVVAVVGQLVDQFLLRLLFKLLLQFPPAAKPIKLFST